MHAHDDGTNEALLDESPNGEKLLLHNQYTSPTDSATINRMVRHVHDWNCYLPHEVSFCLFFGLFVGVNGFICGLGHSPDV